jgi:tRNA(Ile)-lysidine synthase
LTKKQATLEQRILRFIREQHLTSGGRKLVVAVSGGADSVCLLHVLASLQKGLGIKLHVAHLDHRLRGAESEADARFVAELAQQMGIPSTIESRDVPAHQARHHLSPEEAAREVRYNFLAEVAGSVGAQEVMVGHTVDDHVETILMHLIRGTGTRGLRGLQPLNLWKSSGHQLKVIRPLLQVSREETAEYCNRHRLAPRMDTSNLSLSPLRNRIRQQLLPLLRSYNPQAAEAILRTARIAADEIAFLDEEVAGLLGEIASKEGNIVIVDKERFLRLPAALKRHLLRASIEELLGNLKDIETRHIEDIMDAQEKPAGKRISLPDGLIFSVEYDKYLLGRDPAALSPFPVLGAESLLNIPGRTPLSEWQVGAEIIDRERMAEMDDDFTAYLDFDKTGDRLTVRRRKPGDRFQPLGMSQIKKLNEFMIDAKIPHSWRGRIPLVCSSEHMLWVVGWRIDERARVTEASRRVLRLNFKRS